MQLLKNHYLSLLIPLIWCISPLFCGDAFSDFAHALERVPQATTILLEKKTDLPKVRIIVQSDDTTLFDGTSLATHLKELNKKGKGMLFDGDPEVVMYDTVKNTLNNNLQTAAYKTIFVAGWKPTKNTLGYWTPSAELFYKKTDDKTVRNYFGDFETTPKDKSAILVMLVLLSTKENSLTNEKTQQDTFEYKLKQSFMDRSQEDLQGTITAASAIFKDKNFSGLALYSVDPEGSSSAKKLKTTLTDWLKQPLVPTKEISKKLVEKPAKQSLSHQSEQERIYQYQQKQKMEWEKGLKEAESFTFSQKPIVRLIIASEPKNQETSNEAKNQVLNYLKNHQQLYNSVEIVTYDSNAPPLALSNLKDTDQNIYKNIFVFGRKDAVGSYICFRSDQLAFQNYADSTDFSPNTTLLLFVPLDEKVEHDFSSYSPDSIKSTYYSFEFGLNSTGSKYVVMGQSTPMYEDPTTFRVIKRNGEKSTVADWLTWGVDLGGKKPSQKKKSQEIEEKKESTKPLEEPKKQQKPLTIQQTLSPQEQKKIAWEEGLKKALAFTYKKTPKVRIIISTEQGKPEDQQTVKNEITQFLNEKKLIDPKNIVFVNYDVQHDPINLLDGEYKNIFLIGLNGESGKSQFFFREVYFGAEKKKSANKFSPITTLLLIMPLNENVRTSYATLKACYLYDLVQFMGGTWRARATVCGDKYVAVGQTEPFSQAPNIDEPVIKPDGSITTLEDWLTWGVKIAMPEKVI